MLQTRQKKKMLNLFACNDIILFNTKILLQFMKHFKTIFIMVTCFGTLFSSTGCSSKIGNVRGESFVLANSIPSKFWFDEVEPGSVVVRNNYNPNASDTIIFEEGKDYTIDYKKGEIKRSKNSRIPDYSKHSLYGNKNFDYTKVKNYSNERFFIWVDYKTKKDTNISKPILYQKNIEKSLDKLLEGKPFKIIVFGDSISTGAEATEPKFTFFEIFKNYLQKKYTKSKIILENGATGGDTTVDGLNRVEEKVLTHKPDLVLVGFGMNDHNINSVAAEKFYKNLKSIVKQIKDKTGADVLLYSTFPPNPNWNTSSHSMDKYADATKKVAKETQSAYADVYSVWMKALNRKDSSSLLNNNINHPNNFGHWIYTQAFYLK